MSILDKISLVIEQGDVSQKDVLASAKVRGISYMKSEFEKPENLTLTGASEYLGRADRVINFERKIGNLYALNLDANTRDFRYPKWQFDVSVVRLRQVLDIFNAGSLNCWALHNFLTRPHSDLEGRSPSIALEDISFPLELVLEIARRRIDFQQGAS